MKTLIAKCPVVGRGLLAYRCPNIGLSHSREYVATDHYLYGDDRDAGNSRIDDEFCFWGGMMRSAATGLPTHPWPVNEG